MPDFRDVLPPPPWEGPPLPRFTQQSDPSPLIHPAEVDTGIESLIAAKRREWEAKGYRPGLIDKALLWAKQWAWGLLKSPLYRNVTERHPELEEEIARSLYTTGLEQAEKWITAFTES